MNAFSGKQVMTSEEYELLRNLVEGETGIVMKQNRRLTLHSKVSHRLMILGIPTYRDYYDFLISDPAREELFILATHVTDNESYFFRENPS